LRLSLPKDRRRRRWCTVAIAGVATSRWKRRWGAKAIVCRAGAASASCCRSRTTARAGVGTSTSRAAGRCGAACRCTAGWATPSPSWRRCIAPRCRNSGRGAHARRRELRVGLRYDVTRSLGVRLEYARTASSPRGGERHALRRSGAVRPAVPLLATGRRRSARRRRAAILPCATRLR